MVMLLFDKITIQKRIQKQCLCIENIPWSNGSADTWFFK